MKTDKGAGDAPKPDRRAVKLSQFEWSRAASADACLSQSTKHLAARTVIDKFTTKGVARATQKELAKICGMSISALRRAIKELVDGYYLEVEQLGGANRYTMTPPAERIELWNVARHHWEDQCHRWDGAKRTWERSIERWLTAEAQYRWLEAEKRAKEEFTMPIFDAAKKRADEAGIVDPYGLAAELAEEGWRMCDAMTSKVVVDELSSVPVEEFLELARKRHYALRSTATDESEISTSVAVNDHLGVQNYAPRDLHATP